MVSLPNLKYFSLTCYRSIEGFGTYLDNKILMHIPQVHTFTVYIASPNINSDPAIRISNNDIQRTFTNKEHRPMASIVDYFDPYKILCPIFSLPLKFHCHVDIGNNIPNIVFSSVTHLK
ncbi:unnamed protein product [Rotaria sp. Silwood1]|nr:unnamed protein product [Rotaria sp. Silwood1]